jgi:hypothetical protein
MYYNLARMLFNEKKPYDHYHSATEVEQCLREHGFQNINSALLPLILSSAFFYHCMETSAGVMRAIFKNFVMPAQTGLNQYLFLLGTQLEKVARR